MTQPDQYNEPDLSQGQVGDDVRVRCRHFSAAGSFRIGDGVEIEADRIVLGDGATIGPGTRIKAIGGITRLFQMGDHALIDERSNVMVPEFVCGDYTRIFRDALISGYKPARLGHNCWVGQGVILNAAESLTIGNNVRMGGCQIWTHVASGEVLEGSRFRDEAPVVIEDNVWLMGFGQMISPGLTLAEGSVVMAGSAVTKSTEAYHTYSGSPAKDITDKLPAWDRPSPDRKWEMLVQFVDEFLAAHPHALGRVALAADDAALETAADEPLARLIFAKAVRDWARYAGSRHSIFDLSTKTYLKQRTELEVAWQNFALGYRARFIPR